MGNSKWEVGKRGVSGWWKTPTTASGKHQPQRGSMWWWKTPTTEGARIPISDFRLPPYKKGHRQEKPVWTAFLGNGGSLFPTPA